MKAIIALVAFLFFLYFTKPAFAVSVTISDYPSTITEDAFTITASISGATAGTNYLKIDIFEDGTTNYFGETFNNSDWYGGSTYSQYLPITIQTGVTWSGNIQGRIGSPTTTQYDGNGIYKIRLRRYTGGGGYTASEANNSAVTISIAIPTSTPTPTNTPTPAPTSAPTQAPTPTRTPTPSPTPTLTVKPSASPTPKDTLPTSVLGESSESGLLVSPTEAKPRKNVLISNKAKNPNTNFQKILVLVGIVFILSCAILTFHRFKKGRLNQDEKE